MPKTEKVSADAQGVSIATVSARKRVSKSVQAKHTYKVSIHALGQWATDYKAGVYITDIYEAVSKQEAIGMACEYIQDQFPNHSILPDRIKCVILNPYSLCNRQ